MSARPDERDGGEGLEAAVELLERSLGYARLALADVTDAALARPTPCAGWSLADLLSHLEDALDAFTEAAGGAVLAPPGPGGDGDGPDGPDGPGGSDGPDGPDGDGRPAAARVAALRRRAGALLGAWAGAAPAGPAGVRLRDRTLPPPLLVRTAALEVAVHGWDVARATGRGPRLPEELAAALVPTALRVVGPADRGVRFAGARPRPADASYDARLLAFLGRDLTGPGPGDRGEPRTRPGVAP